MHLRLNIYVYITWAINVVKVSRMAINYLLLSHTLAGLSVLFTSLTCNGVSCHMLNMEMFGWDQISSSKDLLSADIVQFLNSLMLLRLLWFRLLTNMCFQCLCRN